MRLLVSLLAVVLSNMFFALGIVAAQDTKAVRSAGAAPVLNGDVPHAREEAIIDARRKAAEQEVGVHLEAQTRVENGQVISQEIEARVDAYVPNYALEKEWRDQDIYRVQILANVATGAAMEREIQAVARRVNSVLVSVQEKNLGKPEAESYVAHALADRLVSAGYRVLDEERLKTIRKETPLLFSAPTSFAPGEARRLASRYLVNVLITGTADSRDNTADLPEYGVPKERMVPSAVARASIRVILSDTAEVVCDKDVSLSKGEFANTPENAGLEALREVGGEAAKALLEGRCIPGKIHEIVVEVGGIPTFEEYQKFTAILKGVRFSKEVRSEGYVMEGNSVFHVTYEEDASFLAARIEADPRYRVVEQSANRIVAKHE